MLHCSKVAPQRLALHFLKSTTVSVTVSVQSKGCTIIKVWASYICTIRLF